jgi:hypothetical protein
MEMAIYRLLKDTTFEPEAVEAMGRAYEDLLSDLRLADRNDPFTEIVAKEIIRIASRGVHSATEIRAMVLTTLGKPAQPSDCHLTPPAELTRPGDLAVPPPARS